MLKFFWTKSTSVWMALVYILLGGILLFYPSMSASLFCWGIGGMLLVYGVIHLFRYWQAKKQADAADGEMVIALLLAILGLLCISVPRFFLSILPFMLGLLLLLLGIFRVPLMLDVFQRKTPQRWFFLGGTLIPLILGIVLLFNPFKLVTGLISFFGVCLIISGVLDLSGVLSEKRHHS